MLVQVGYGDARSKAAVVWMLRRQEGRRLRRQVVQLRGRHTIIYARHDFLCNAHGVHVLWLEAVAELLDARSDLVESDRLLFPIALDDQHFSVSNFAEAVRAGASRPGLLTDSCEPVCF